MERKTIRKNLATLCERLDEMIATANGPRPEAAVLKPSSVRADMSPIGGVTVVVVDPGDFEGEYETIVHRWPRFQIEVRSSREKLPENGIIVWEPGSDWEGKLEALSQESVRKNAPDFDAVRAAWNEIRTRKRPNGNPAETVFFGTLIDRAGFMLEVYDGCTPRELTALPNVWKAIKDHFAYYKSFTTRKKKEHLLFSTIAVMRWTYSPDLSKITGLKASTTFWPGSSERVAIPEEEVAAAQQWAENAVGQIFKDAGAAEIPVEWVSKEAFYATEVLANVL